MPDRPSLLGAPEPCPCCENGEWFSECCDGSRGCSCHGMRVPMGQCNVCHGTGSVDGSHNPRANVDAIQGLCFLGTGPQDGSWDHAPRGGMTW